MIAVRKEISFFFLTYIAFDYVVRVCVDVPGQAKVTDLCDSALS